MVNLKYAFIELSKKIVFTCITILQLSVTFILIYNIIYIKNEVSLTTTKVTSIYKNDNTYVIDPFYNMDDILNKKDLKIMEFYNFLKENKDFIHCTGYEDHLLMGNFDNSQNYILTQNYAPQKEGTQYFPFKTLKVDYNYLQEFKYNIIEGSPLTMEDFENTNNNIPVLLGCNYKNIYNLDDVIEYYDYSKGKKTLIVKGFIESGYNFVDTIITQQNIINLDNYIIYPLQAYPTPYVLSNDNTFEVYNRIFQSFIIIKNDSTKDLLKTTASSTIGEIKIRNTNELLKDYIDRYILEENIVTTIFIIVFIMCSIGIITNMINSIKNSYKLFAIHMLNGASQIDIYSRVFFEIIIINIASLFLTFSGLRILSSMNYVSLKLSYIIQLLGFILIIMMSILLVTIIYIKKVSINNLLRR